MLLFVQCLLWMVVPSKVCMCVRPVNAKSAEDGDTHFGCMTHRDLKTRENQPYQVIPLLLHLLNRWRNQKQATQKGVAPFLMLQQFVYLLWLHTLSRW